MQHSFDVDIANKLGVFPAIILSNIEFWYIENKTNDRNYYKGKYWTYNSIKALCEQFPYMSKDQIRRSLIILEEEGYVISDCFNDNKMDRTKWYTLSQSYIDFCAMHLALVQNAFSAGAKSNTDINITDIYKEKEIIKEKETEVSVPIQTVDADSNKSNIPADVAEIFEFWNSCDIIKHRNATKDIVSEIKRALKHFSKEDIIEAIRRYKTVYSDKNYYFSYKWNLVLFLKQKNAMSDFMDEGAKWNNYVAETSKNQPEPKKAVTINFAEADDYE